MKTNLLIATVAAAALLLPGGAAATGSTNPAPRADSSPTAAPETTPMERVSAYTTPSIVYLDIEWAGRVYDTYNGQFLNDGNPFYYSFSCTGYVVNSGGYIATAGHCVDVGEVRPMFFRDAAQWALDNGYYVSKTLTLDDVLGFGDYVVMAPDANVRRPSRDVTVAWSVSAGGVQTGKALPARVVKSQSFSQGDGALLKVEATNLNAVPLNTDDLEIGTAIVAIGYPASVDLVTDATFSPSFKEGSISSKKTVSNGLLTVYEISAAVSGGMSGGPTVNLDSEVVAFNSFGINSQIETQQFNFVRPASIVAELLGDAGTSNTLSEDSVAYRAGLDAYFAGDKTTAVEELQSVVDSQPTHELATQYLEKAKDLPDPPPPEESGSSTGLVVGVLVGIAVLALAAVAVVLLVVRRRRSRPGPAQTYAVVSPSPGPAPVPPAPAPPAAVTPTAVMTPTPLSAPPSAGAAAGTVTAAPTPAGADAEEEIFCPECGTKHGPHQRFCTHCGSAL